MFERSRPGTKDVAYRLIRRIKIGRGLGAMRSVTFVINRAVILTLHVHACVMYGKLKVTRATRTARRLAASSERTKHQAYLERDIGAKRLIPESGLHQGRQDNSEARHPTSRRARHQSMLVHPVCLAPAQPAAAALHSLAIPANGRTTVRTMSCALSKANSVMASAVGSGADIDTRTPCLMVVSRLIITTETR